MDISRSDQTVNTTSLVGYAIEKACFCVRQIADCVKYIFEYIVSCLPSFTSSFGMANLSDQINMSESQISWLESACSPGCMTQIEDDSDAEHPVTSPKEFLSPFEVDSEDDSDDEHPVTSPKEFLSPFEVDSEDDSEGASQVKFSGERPCNPSIVRPLATRANADNGQTYKRIDEVLRPYIMGSTVEVIRNLARDLPNRFQDLALKLKGIKFRASVEYLKKPEQKDLRNRILDIFNAWLCPSHKILEFVFSKWSRSRAYEQDKVFLQHFLGISVNELNISIEKKEYKDVFTKVFSKLNEE